MHIFLWPVPRRTTTPTSMKKERKIVSDSGEKKASEFESLSNETDQSIMEQINKRKEENQALKKLLENLNTSFPKH